MQGNYQCWWVASLGIPVKCCEECHKNGKYEVITTPQGTRVTVCCTAMSAYRDYNGDVIARSLYRP